MTTSTIGLADPADLEPSLLYERTYATRRRPTYIDAAVLLSLMFLLLAFIPAREVLPGATDVGRPALVIGFLLFLWWAVTRFSPGLVMVGPQPIRWAFFGYFGVLLIGYAVGFLRGLTSMEANAADRTMLYFCCFGGALLTAADGLPNWLKLRTLLKVLIDEVDFEGTRNAVDDLMGTKPEARFRFIQDRAAFAENLDI